MNKDKIKCFLSYYKPYLKVFFLDLLAAFIMAAISLIIPLLIRYLINTYLKQDNAQLSYILQIGGFMLFLVLLEMGCNFYVTYKGHSMGVDMEKDLRSTLFAHYQKLSFNFYDDASIGSLMSRCTSDLFQLTELYHHGPEDIIISIVKFIGAFIILININVKLTLLIFITIPFMIIYAYHCNIKMGQGYVNTKVATAKVSSCLEDNLNGLRVVKSFANEDLENKRFNQVAEQYAKERQKTYLYMAQYFSGVNAMVTLITVIAAIYGSILIYNHNLTVTDLFTFTLYISNFTDPIKKVLNFAETFQDGISGFNRFYELINIIPDIQDKPGAIKLENVKGFIEYKNVSFQYQSATTPVFTNLNLTVQPGEQIALVGSSGVGKSTLCSLLPRFYEPQHGVIQIDGQDITNFTLSSLRQHIGIVQQDVYLFSGTVYENIAYGKPGCTRQEVIQAAKAANAHEFIISLPYGYDSNIGSHGVKLSGGQKQRISIARVFLKNPPILIFDEATSALDNESEHIIQESLQSLAKNRTTFIIAHRLSTVQNANRIVVLSHDGIAEQGTHQQLIENNGIYAHLVAIQSLSIN